MWHVAEQYEPDVWGTHQQEGLQTLWRYVRTLRGKETTLNLLWLKWLPLHHEHFRDGCLKNLVRHPELGLVPNPPKDPDQLEMACEFVDELI